MPDEAVHLPGLPQFSLLRNDRKYGRACVYLPPSLNSDDIEKFYDPFRHCYDTLTCESLNIVIIIFGDFNPTGNGFQERIISKQCQLKQLVKNSTRGKAAVDLEFASIHHSSERPTVLVEWWTYQDAN